MSLVFSCLPALSSATPPGGLSLRKRLRRLASGLVAVASLALAPHTGAVAADDGRTLLEARNKWLVQRFYAEVVATGRTELIGRYVAEGLIQHDPAVAPGRQGLASKLAAQAATSPRPTVTIKRTIADGPYVAVHSQLTAQPGNEFTGTAQVDLYRLHNEQIVEHWAVQQSVPATSASGRSMFSDDYRYSGQPAAPSQAREETNKALARKLLSVLFVGQDTSIVSRYWAPDFFQHNPQAPDGTATLYSVSQVPKPTPFGAWNTRIILAEGDLVFSLSQMSATTDNLASDLVGTAAGDLFRMVDGVIVEHWDVLGPVPATSRNGNSPFSELFAPTR